MAISKIGSNATAFAGGLDISDGDITVASGHGVSFAASSDVTGKSSELLDDYEEGVFQTSMTCATSGSVTLNGSFDNLRYTKVGRLVTINGDMRISSVSSPQGALQIAIPFATENTGTSSTATAIGTVITHSVAKQSDQVGRFIVVAGGNVSVLNLMYETSSTRLGAQSQNLSLGNDEIVITMTYTAA